MKTGGILFSLSLLFFIACRKNGPTKPVNINVTTVDTPKQITVPFKPYTDTFYGAIYEGDAELPVTPGSSVYIYVHHISVDTLVFSSSGTGQNYSGQNYAQGTVNDPYCVLGFDEYIAVSDSNSYSWSYKFSNYSFKFIKDSLYYSSANDFPESMDTYFTYIAGKRNATGRH